MGKKKHFEDMQESDPERMSELKMNSEKSETSEISEPVKSKKMKKLKTVQVSLEQTDESFTGSVAVASENSDLSKPRKRKKVKSEQDSVQESVEPIESSKEKKLRFNIDGETVDSGKEASKGDKTQVKKERKPRWSEERKIEERKRKASEHPTEEPPKIKKRKKHKKKKEPVNQKSSQDLPTLAIQYLQTWQYDRSSWKFSKFKQTWLLKNMFDINKIPSSVFPVLVKYISSSQGGARLKTYEAASKMIDSLEEKAGNEAKTEEEEIARCLTEESEEDREEIHQRARSIMQALSDCT